VHGILCSGNIVYDILVRPVDAIQFGATTWVDEIARNLGGNGASTSYTAAMLGVPVRLLGMVGSDPFGSEVLGILKSGGVDVSSVERSSAPTATTVGIVRSDGARAFLHRPGASREAFPQPLDFSPHQDGSFSHFHLANPYGLPAMRAHAAESLRRAKAAGFSTSLDTGWDARGEWMGVLAPCLPHTDLLFANEDEGRMLSGETGSAGMSKFFRERGAQTVVLKLGARGCEVYSEQGSFSAPAFAVEPVDSTGAGDCFVGGFLSALQRGASLREAAKLANAAGALSIQKLGAVPGILPLEETLAWMAQQTSFPGRVESA
jgi:sugar/nucleoside kinase (ribokinase family)